MLLILILLFTTTIASAGSRPNVLWIALDRLRVARRIAAMQADMVARMIDEMQPDMVARRIDEMQPVARRAIVR